MIFPSLVIKVERWKFNKDYGVYVSTLGNFKDRYKRRLPIKIYSHGGYCSVQTEQGYKLAHRIVMMTWRPIPDAENLTVDHLNHNKRDNSISNLEWVTREENWSRASKDFLNSLEKDNENLKDGALKYDYTYVINGQKFSDMYSAIAWTIENRTRAAEDAIKFDHTSEEKINSKVKEALEKKKNAYDKVEKNLVTYGYRIHVIREERK